MRDERGMAKGQGEGAGEEGGTCSTSQGKYLANAVSHALVISALNVPFASDAMSFIVPIVAQRSEAIPTIAATLTDSAVITGVGGVGIGCSSDGGGGGDCPDHRR